MCMQLTSIRPHQCWNWHGDEIVHESIIPASRQIPNTKIKHYQIDIRSFVTPGNAVVQQYLDKIVKNWGDHDKLRFYARRTSDFDFRAFSIFNWFSNLSYLRSNREFDQWLFPEESIARNGGDCEDLSFLLASLLIDSGISRDCVRVALGRVIDHQDKGKEPHDHAWVMYQLEVGAWQIFDPLAKVQQNKSPSMKNKKSVKNTITGLMQEDLEYVPFFVFNSDHLWRVRSSQAIAGKSLQSYLKKHRSFWKGFNPSFAASVHNSIFDEVLGKAGMSALDLLQVKAASLRVDVNILDYDPRDHFDFAYIDEGWERVKQRLLSDKLDDLGLALHAIGDFYAHSMYAHFAYKSNSGRIEIYDPDNPPLAKEEINYDFSDLPMPGANVDAQTAAKSWQGKLISGQWWRWYTTYPDKLQKPEKLQPRRNLPDHDFLAVDSRSEDNPHHFFNKNKTYAQQFCLRRNAAIEHIASEYKKWCDRHSKPYKQFSLNLGNCQQSG